MTVTWKDYIGPALTEGGRYFKTKCDCNYCANERAARKAWAAEQNEKPSVAEAKSAVVSLQQGADNPSVVRTFATGANRDLDTNKLDLEGFLSPRVLEAFGEYMNFNRHLADGSVRDSDNWQKGIPLDVYAKSAWRHFFDFWKAHRGLPTKEGILWGLLGLLFNVQGYVHELLKKDPYLLAKAIAAAQDRRLSPAKAASEPALSKQQL